MPDRRPLPPFTEDIPDPGNEYLPQARRLSPGQVPAEADVREDLVAVYVRDRGRWRPTVLTGWGATPTGARAARLQLELGAEPVWIAADAHVVVPVQPVDAVPER